MSSSPPPDGPSARRRIPPWAWALLLVGPTILCWRVLFLGEAFIGSDAGTYFMWRDVRLARALGELDLPGWDPSLALGMPFANHPLTQSWYPPKLGLFFLLGFPLAAGVLVWLQLVAAGVGTTLLARVEGIRRGPLLAGVAYQTAGAVASCHASTNTMCGVTLLPWIILGLLHATRSPGWRAVAAGLCPIALGSLVDMEFTTYGIGLGLLASLVRPGPRRRVVAGLRGLATAGLGYAVASPGIAAVAAFVQTSNRAGPRPLDESLYLSLHPQRAIELVWPEFFAGKHPGYGEFGQLLQMIYPGLLVVLLALVAFLGRRALAGGRRARGAVVLWGIVALLAYAVSLGRVFPFYAWLHELPFFGRFRNPQKYFVLTTLALALLAGAGLSRLVAASPLVWLRRRARGLPPALPRVGAGALVALAAGVHFLGPAGLAGAILTVVLVLCACSLRLPHRVSVPLVALLLALELGALGRTWMPSTPGDAFRHDSWAGQEARERLRTGRSLGRVLVDPELIQRGFPSDEGGRGTRYAADILSHGAGRASGTRTFDPSLAIRFEHARPVLDEVRTREGTPRAVRLRRRLLRIFGGDLVVTMTEASADWEALGYRPLDVRRREDLVLLEADPPAPGFAVVPRVRSAYSEREARRRLGAPDHDPGEEAVVVGGGDRPPGAPGEARLVRFGPDLLEFEIPTEGAGYLRIGDAWAPGWTARVDGEPAPILRSDLAARLVPFPEGTRSIVVAYSPPLGTGVPGRVGLVTLLAIALYLGLSGPSTTRDDPGRPRGKLGDPPSGIVGSS